MKVKKRLFIPLLILLGFISNSSFAFTFTLSEVTIVNENCSGAGSLTFNPTGTVAGSTMSYTIYKLPDTTNIFFNQIGNLTVSGLIAATYRIIATETVSGVTSAPQTVDATIIKTFTPLTYSRVFANQACASLSDLTINVLTGTPAAVYAFSITGPINVGPQTSNVFTNLPAGFYNISVRDICGATVPGSVTITTNPTAFSVGNATFSNTGACNTITVNNLITANAGTQLSYPLTINYNFTPPPPALPFTRSQTINTGGATTQIVSETVPYPIAAPFTPYTYTISVSDNCPSSPDRINQGPYNIINEIRVSETKLLIACDRFFAINVTNFAPTYTLTVIGPSGVVTPNTPGPYSTSPVVFGGVGNNMPLGAYSVNVVDSCGKTLTTPYTFSLTNLDTRPSITGVNNGCLSTTGTITVTAASPRTIVAATVTAAPTGYPASPLTLPYNVTANINAAGILILNPVPQSAMAYDITVTDNCGDVYNLTTTIGPYVDQKFGISNRPSCVLGKTSIQGFSQNVGSKITNVTISSAPAGFPFPTSPTPFNANQYIVSWGAFYMDDLPPGSYTFNVIDDCNFSNTISFNFVGYSETQKVRNYIPHCGSFDVDLNFVTTAEPTTETFWLQQKINATDWGRINPFPVSTTVVYPPNTIPDGTNSYPLINNSTNLNFTLNGEFRIVRVYKSFNNGIVINSGSAGLENNCIEIYNDNFMFNQALEIKDGYKSSCNAAATQDVIINAVGTPPLNYSYIDSLGNTINNGSNNIFTGIPTGTYTFLVSSVPCASTVPRTFSIATMSALITPTKPTDMVQCSTNITNNETFNLNSRTPLILGTLDPTKYTVTYFETLANAQNNTSAIPNPITYNPPTNPATIYARVIYNALPNCYENTNFELVVGLTPRINLNSTYQVCFSNTVSLDASTGNPAGTTYLWSDGTTTSTNAVYTVTQAGVTNLTVTATKIYNGVSCISPTKSIQVIISEKPKLDHLDIVDWTDNDNSIAVYTSNTGAFEYSIDGGFNYQSSNIFTNLTPGVYRLIINDLNFCGKYEKDVWILHYPKFFTPNNDGVNDYWHIPNSKFEKDFTVYIYDRYGRLLSNFNSNSNGWDGNFNNKQMISDDYWFVVYRQDGRIHKGHFAIKR